MPLSAAEFTKTPSGRELRFKSGAIPCVSLSLAVGAAEPPDESELLVVSTRSGLVAVTVSELIDRRRVAVKNLGPILEGAGHITGTALLGGGQVLVVLDPNFLGVVARHRPLIIEDKPRVLVVDDSAGVRQLLSATLNGAGFEVEVASGAREAVLAMATDGFAAMVVDYSMPRSNGVELVRAMRASDVQVPIVLVRPRVSGSACRSHDVWPDTWGVTSGTRGVSRPAHDSVTRYRFVAAPFSRTELFSHPKPRTSGWSSFRKRRYRPDHTCVIRLGRAVPSTIDAAG